MCLCNSAVSGKQDNEIVAEGNDNRQIAKNLHKGYGYIRLLGGLQGTAVDCIVCCTRMARRYDKEHLRAIDAENRLKDAENVFKIIEQNMNNYKKNYQK